jgi:hypothetical protein
MPGFGPLFSLCERHHDMTTPDIAGLCERLDILHEWQSSARDKETITLSKATLERQAAEIKRLRDSAAKTFADVVFLRKDHPGQSEQFYAEEASSLCRRALAALTGEDTTGSPTSQNTEPGLAFSDAGEL